MQKDWIQSLVDQKLAFLVLPYRWHCTQRRAVAPALTPRPGLPPPALKRRRGGKINGRAGHSSFPLKLQSLAAEALCVLQLSAGLPRPTGLCPCVQRLDAPWKRQSWLSYSLTSRCCLKFTESDSVSRVSPSGVPWLTQKGSLYCSSSESPAIFA